MQLRKILTLFTVFLFLASVLPISGAYAAHGCLTNEPDRDEDGVPDKDDSAPDDPTVGGLAEKYCGTEPLTMKLFFIPFSAEIRGPITKDSIESKKANAIWFCSKNPVGDSILAVLDEAVANGEMPDSAAKMSPNHIRLKLVTVRSGTDETTYYADKSGISTKNTQDFLLSPDKMVELETMVEKLEPDCGSKTKTHCSLADSPL